MVLLIILTMHQPTKPTQAKNVRLFFERRQKPLWITVVPVVVSCQLQCSQKEETSEQSGDNNWTSQAPSLNPLLTKHESIHGKMWIRWKICQQNGFTTTTQVKRLSLIPDGMCSLAHSTILKSKEYSIKRLVLQSHVLMVCMMSGIGWMRSWSIRIF